LKLGCVVHKLRKLKENLFSPDEETRRLAVADLCDYPVTEIKESLFRALGDESWRVRKEAVELISSISASADMTEELIGLLRSQDNAGLRNAAVEILVRQGANAVSVLHSYVNDDDHDVRKFIIDIMGSIGDASFVPDLIHALDDPDANVRSAAVENLGKIGDTRALEPLLNSLEKADEWLQYTILEALGRIGAPVPVSCIAPLAGRELLKKAVYECLGVVGNVEVVPVLLEGLGEKSKNARRSAVCALEKIRQKLPGAIVEDAVDSRLRALKDSPVVDLLLDCLSSSDTSVRKAVVRVLGIIGDERAAGALLRGCGDDRLRSCCLQAFKTIGGIVTPFLETEFPSADEAERRIIVYLCGEMELKGCGSLLKQGLVDPAPTVRKEAAIACGKLGLAELIPGIAVLLDDFDEDVREGAIIALARLAQHDRKGVARVAGALASADDPDKRRNSAHLFGALHETDELSLLMKDVDVAVRKTAVSALADLKDKSSIGHLLMALVDEDPEVRIASASALGEMAGEKAIDSLLFLLKDEDMWVRCAALKSLGKLKGAKAVRAIEVLLENSGGAVMIAALEALDSIGGSKAQDLLERALKNDDEEVVKAAMELLAGRGDAWVEKYGDELISHPHWGVRNRFAGLVYDLLGEKALPRLRKALSTETDGMVREQIRELVEKCR
jgi:HEAT repeat protein